MTGERNLRTLVASMDPELRPGRFVFTTGPDVPRGADPIALVREDEGVSLVVSQDDADRLGLAYPFVAAMITLRVHSALDAVGLTAAVSAALADDGISCNVVAGYFHDHLFVAADDGERALAILRRLASEAAGA